MSFDCDDDDFDDQLYETILVTAAEEKIDKLEKRLKQNVNNSRKLWTKQVSNSVELVNEIHYFINIIQLKSYLNDRINNLANKNHIVEKFELVQKLNRNIKIFSELNSIPSNVLIELDQLNRTLIEFIDNFQCLTNDCDYGTKINEICTTLSTMNDLIQKNIFGWDESYNLSNNMAAEVLKLFSNELNDLSGDESDQDE